MHYRIHVNGKPFDVVVEILSDAAPAYGTPAPLPTAAPIYAPPVSAYAVPPVAPPAPMPTPLVPPTPAPAAQTGAEERVTSPFPGSVMQISVAVGQAVTAGQCLMILEAMKMQNEIVAPQASVVKQILVSKGATVNTDDVLIVLG